ncbi:adenosylcobinamide-GDP ribazoletransferase [Rhizobium halophilum]|uniref:adenosylcobinamide-GDP ribazoletransferase n=1 Tax=Rhizobium halophilum TaxID=2846852 RepID=UPI001EFD0446|nr:adenosylcobinamide-GDP ribazoletransferase [Rhizobium halophilum]MCF6368391.1 adenosylcobinamide-GDP ribazoletransferase [Rhizobium halophilum]
MPNVSDLFGDLARSLGFLSRFPISSRFFEGHDGSVSRAVRVFPLAGLVIALPAALLLWLLLEWKADPLLAALIALGAVTLSTGALHEDGLADTADGLGGGRDREHILSVMKDSRTGSYGVIALILSYGLRATALASLAGPSAALPALALLSAAGGSRALMVGHWRALPPARHGGIAVAAGRPEADASTFALASAALICLLLLVSVAGLLPLLFATALAALGVFGLTRHAAQRIGGHTGDTIGASQQVGEIVFLLALALAV